MKKQNRMLKSEFGKRKIALQIFDLIHYVSRYILPSSVKINQSLPTLADHLQAYIKSKDRPIIIYLHGQDGTR